MIVMDIDEMLFKLAAELIKGAHAGEEDAIAFLLHLLRQDLRIATEEAMGEGRTTH